MPGTRAAHPADPRSGLLLLRTSLGGGRVGARRGHAARHQRLVTPRRGAGGRGRLSTPTGRGGPSGPDVTVADPGEHVTRVEVDDRGVAHHPGAAAQRDVLDVV